MKIYLINETSLERQWLESALQLTEEFDTIISLERGYELDVDEANFSSALIIVTQEQFPALRRQLSKSYAATELPCPILILSQSFDSFDASGYSHVTLDAFPTHSITPQILKYLISTLKREFRKDVRLKRLAHYDTLTGATNRYLFNDRAKQAIASAKRQREAFAMMYFDLDKFKQINDRYGHNTGDEYLKAFVNVVEENIRDTDTLGRLGGDEFALLMPKSPLKDAEIKAKQLLKALAVKRVINHHSLNIATSIGVVAFNESSDLEGLDYKTLVGLADGAAFRAKKKGKHRYEVANRNITTKAESALTVQA